MDAMAKGEFENLKGTGKPLPDRVGAKKFQEVNWLRPLEPFGHPEKNSYEERPKSHKN